MTSVTGRIVCYFVKMGINIINHSDVWVNLFVFNLLEGRIQSCAGADKNSQNSKTTFWDFSSLYAVIYFCMVINVTGQCQWIFTCLQIESNRIC